MEDFYQEEKTRLVESTWKIKYDEETNTAKLVNENGLEMDPTTFAVCLDALNNTRYDMNEKRYGEPTKARLDEFTRKRFGIENYQLLLDQEIAEDTREVFEVYSDDNQIFTLDNYTIYNHRKKYDYVVSLFT